MEQKKNKRILYSICFICFVFIDWIRGSQDGVYWQTAINLTGLLMAVIIMSHFRWRQERKKPYLIWLLLWMVGSAVGYPFWSIAQGIVHPTKYWAAAVSVCLIGIAALRMWKERKAIMSQNTANKILLRCWLVMSIWMTCSRMGEIWPLWYAVMFLLLYLVPFTKEESRDLWDGAANGIIAGFFMLQIWAYGFRHYDELRYAGAYSNYNMNALFYLVTYIALLYRSHSLRWQKRQAEYVAGWKHKIAQVVLWLLTVGMWGFVFLTMTRTAYIVIIVITLIYAAIEFRVFYPEKYSRLLMRSVAFVLGVVLVFPAVYLTVRYLPTILHYPVWLQDEYSVDKVHSFDPADSGKYTSLEEVFGGIFERLGMDKDEVPGDKGAYRIPQSFPLLASAEVSAKMLEQDILTKEEATSSMRVRLKIAEKYLENMNWTGHTLDEGHFQIAKDYHAWHAQNVFLQVGFCYGIPVGILFIVVIVALGIQFLRLAIQKRSCESILPLLVWLLFVGYGMLESVWYPGQTILLLTYMVPKILIDNKRN